ncbi:S-adenosyl-L-methionine-dependent methyltransferase [Polyplosphaeria fusca]|uniref:S-adenosyl-L-methionine-dependent methyltransferase n=1 Tax=Polyplosphaeria fusca TaxID=682080 RepID=A0A9P4UV04_9PLEO|nr:S-adenosyl-L-methionine-dependent methyltransferase [Polyplosphaeria fusca]
MATIESQHRDKTFRIYDAKQGQNYHEVRRNYHSTVYQSILDHHEATGGQFGTILDVGCGPGTATRSLAPHFTTAIGIDPGEGMISTARSLGGTTSTEASIRFDTSSAETLGSELLPPVEESSVDLISAATCAHWFDMPDFWRQAAKTLKPGGTVAIWASSSLRTHPSMPNAAKLQAAIDSHEELLKDYYVPANLLTRDLYRELPLPWTMNGPLEQFDEQSFARLEWGTGDEARPSDEFFAGPQGGTLDMLEKVLGTGSPVVAWRKANPSLVATEKDPVNLIIQRLRDALHEVGIEPGKEFLKGGVQGVVILVKKKV